jgi:hypothetical protein
MQLHEAVKALEKQHAVKKLFTFGDCTFVHVLGLVTDAVTKKLNTLGPIASKLREGNLEADNERLAISNQRESIGKAKAVASVTG